MFNRLFNRLFNRVTRLNVDLQHLIVLTFPRTQSSYKVYTQKWWKDGKLLRENDGCAVVQYYQNGNIHTQGWWKNGKKHRDNGQSAIITYDINGQIISQETWMEGYRYIY